MTTFYSCWFSGSVWDEFEDTSDNETKECKTCSKRLKAIRGSKSGLQAHVAWHAKQGRVINREELKSWLVAAMITILNIPCRAFGSIIMAILFWMARLGPINDQMARRYTDAEAE